MSHAITFPPLLTGIAVPGDPFEAALASVAVEVEPGAVFYGIDPSVMRAAIVLAPEEPLDHAVRAVMAVGLGLNDAIGALAPPEVAVHLAWPDRIKVNGAMCGRLRAVADTADPRAEPDWLIVGVEIAVVPETFADPGQAPDRTSLHEEGCGEISVPDLIETWGRHMMNWLHIYLTDGFEPLHREWLTKADGRGGDLTYPAPGRFVGLDEMGGLILKCGDTTTILPLSSMVEAP